MENKFIKRLLGMKIIEKLKENRKKILIISICVLILGIGFYKFGYLNKGIGMSTSTKQEKIDKLIYRQNYDEAKKLANIYMENETKENQDAIDNRIEKCEETNSKNVDDALEYYKQVTIDKKVRVMSSKQATMYNINDWINDMDMKASTTLTNNTSLSGNATVKFTYTDKDKNVIDTEIETVNFEPHGKVKVSNKMSNDLVKNTSKEEVLLIELHFTNN
ncbi:hypothetical protein [Clostridium sp. ZBS13]|uniref:hypothetical protein n=1 Tax=Clostridium sp. ZBS13 TaxID=2949971 RepID=UPI002079D969|nr:hypothetical protein [Clostridium sp. ZBS13]